MSSLVVFFAIVFTPLLLPFYIAGYVVLWTFTTLCLLLRWLLQG
jgi:hypothetical protein